MKKRIVVSVALIVAACAVGARAEVPGGKGPELIRFKMKDLELPFKHWKHQAALNNECFHCHNKELGKIDGWGKDTAHSLCISCHELEDKGPVYCRQCHTGKK